MSTFPFGAFPAADRGAGERGVCLAACLSLAPATLSDRGSVEEKGKKTEKNGERTERRADRPQPKWKKRKRQEKERNPPAPPPPPPICTSCHHLSCYVSS
ncbi:uncharacterized protein LOC135092941 isoform X4 [Scylla paramamosain]|uniref:uncharacterized protein LOC135092941 isoform X4 n=1 Tax=Scylla paramamosain TaxID=85552 RepID=UPI003082BC85